MRKIPTLFVRDPEDRRHLLPACTPGCEWVLAGEGVATRKFDGTCTMFDGTDWWVRREVKVGKARPANFVEVEHDEVTSKTVGWEPVGQSGFAKFFAEAVVARPDWEPGTYELCGPKVNGNPENLAEHVLIRHGETHARVGRLAGFQLLDDAVDAPRDFDGLRDFLLGWEAEGLVWHHPDGRMAKLKRRDFE